MPRPFRFLADAREVATIRQLTETARRAEAIGIDTLDALYPTQADYYSAVVNVTKGNLQNGFITNDEARTTLNDALAVRIGRSGLVASQPPVRSR